MILDPTSESASSGIDNLADAVTHARFVGTDPSSDEVVLMKILQVRYISYVTVCQPLTIWKFNVFVVNLGKAFSLLKPARLHTCRQANCLFAFCDLSAQFVT